MRNGNAPNGKIYAIPYNGSYRTYEEWKLQIPQWGYNRILRSYRTYEEWKLTSLEALRYQTRLVLTVPMRNGNVGDSKRNEYPTDCSYRTYEEWKHG